MTNSKPELVRQIADAMECTPERWWRGFEYSDKYGGFYPCLCEEDVWDTLAGGYEVRPRPRTIRINVKVPEPMQKMPEDGQPYWVMRDDTKRRASQCIWRGSEADIQRFNSGIWPTEHEAQQAADAIFGALGRNAK